tara:strand:- start:468 stop:812 length:345 start_codon:yes stop_codon:yes gene_type:complete
MNEENNNEEKKEYQVLNQFKPKKRAVLATSLDPDSIERNIPADVVWIDDAFYIKKTRFGLYMSILKEPYGARFLTGATEKGVIEMTRWHLKCLQDGTLQDYTRVVNSGVVGGKL